LSALLERYFNVVETILENKVPLSEMDLLSIMRNLTLDNQDDIISLFLKKQVLLITHSGKAVYPRTFTQKKFIDSLSKNDIIFAVGPAGTGKTYLSVLYAVSLLKANLVKKIILVRPIVEAGEKLGYLPGDVKEKIDPYLIPLYDGLYEALGKETAIKMQERGNIEIAPLAYMRGRTLEDAIVILDEGQNATLIQMKMFLTRLGFGSKMIITGDITQIDLPNRLHSGLVEALDLFNDIPGIAVITFSNVDVMRNPLVQKIIQKYEGRYGN
ncbi:MAG TPA: PhoH family protein, partial [Bacilli bacterium]|nr:PhoH family protein [Bacilli bacterium]